MATISGTQHMENDVGRAAANTSRRRESYATSDDLRHAKNQPAAAKSSTTTSGAIKQSTANSFSGTLAEALQSIAPEMLEVQRQLKAAMRSNDPFADALIGYGWSLGGKRLRPALLLLAAKAVGQTTEESIRLGAVVELVHTATLVHDDVIDGASFRRHVPTVNSQWDTHCSILLGDFLFTQAYYLASLSETPIPSRLVGAAARQVCEGEIRQRGTIQRWEISEAEYLDILRAKTAELCAVSSHLGALSAGAPTEWTAKLEAYGRELGLAFQIFDDWLDLWGDPQTVGKSLGTDLVTGKPTLPVLRLLDQLDGQERLKAEAILRGPAENRQAELMPMLQRSDASSYTLRVASQMVHSAKEHLSVLPPSISRTALEAIADFSIARGV